MKTFRSALSRSCFSSRWLVATLVIAASLLGATRTQARIVTSSRFIPFAGEVFDEDTSENVVLAGQVHLVTLVDHSSGRGIVHTNLPATFGAGETSGLAYLAIGADVSFPPTPIFPPTPVRDALKAAPLFFQFFLTFDADGKLQSGEATIGDSTTSCNPEQGNCRP